MKKSISLIVSLLFSIFGAILQAQTPFTVTWSFDGNTGASSSNPNVSGGGAVTNGVNFAGVGTYVAGAIGQAVNVQHWSTTGCDNNEFVQFTIQPLNGEKITIAQLSFYYSRSAAGPHQLKVKASIDGFAANLIDQGVADGFQQVVINLSGGAYTNQSGSISFRVMACNADNTGGTLRLDNVVISGAVTQTPLPVELLYFRAQLQHKAVLLLWATAWERNADRFLVQRSRDLREFLTITSLSAIGESGQNQQYSFMDQWPDVGATYYRLRQVDRDGSFSDSKAVAVVLDDDTPELAVLTNPSSDRQIRVVLRNMPEPVFRLLDLTGQEVPCQAYRQADGTWIVQIIQSLEPKVYVLQAQSGALRFVQRVMIY